MSGFLSANTIHLSCMTRSRSMVASPAYSLSTTALHNTVEDSLNNGNVNGSRNKKRMHRKRHQLRQRHQHWKHNNSQTYQKADEDEVHEWLLQSTSLILGEDLTLKLINYESITDIEKQEIPTKDHKHFASTDEEYILHAESVMRAWSQWIARCSTGSSRKSTLDDVESINGEKVFLCSTTNASTIVNTILNKALVVIDRRRGGDEGEVTSTAVRVVNWDTKLIELVNVAIDACANSKNVKQAEHWLQLLQQSLPLQKAEFEGKETSFSKLLHSGLGNYVLNLYEEAYRGVIRACIRSQDPKSLERAIELLDDLSMQQQNLSDLDKASRLNPTTQTYNLVLYGLANCNPSLKNAERAEKILQQMIACENQRHQTYSASCGPDSNTFRQVITAWTKSCSNDGVANSRRILDQMLSDFSTIDPDASTFNAIITLYLKLGKTDEALSLFDQMTSLHQSGRSGTKPDIYSFNLLLNAMTKQPPHSQEDIEEAEELLETSHRRFGVRPDASSYNILIDAWAKSHVQDAANRAELLLESMGRSCQHDRSVAPDAYSFTSTINAIERSRHHRARGAWAEKVFDQMEELHSQGLVESPTTPVYNALLNCLITCEEKGSLERAEVLFSDIVSASLANTRTYNTMIKGYSMFRRSKIDGSILSFSRPRKAEKLLDEMELSWYSKDGEQKIMPDKYSYTTVISAYGRSNVRRKSAKASMILHRMIDCYSEGHSAARPGTYAFNVSAFFSLQAVRCIEPKSNCLLTTFSPTGCYQCMRTHSPP